MPYINRSTIMGHLGRDPEQRSTAGGITKTAFSVAVADKWTGKDGQKHDETEWFNVVAWRMDWLADQLHKGDLVYVEGKTKTREYQDKDGQKRKITELVADRVLPLSAASKEVDRSGLRTDQTGWHPPGPCMSRPATAPVKDDGFNGMGVSEEDVDSVPF